MTELRKDPIVGRWVIISTERAKRPQEFAREPSVRKGGVCPLCPGSERMTPPEILAYRNGGSPNDPNWTLRVVSNKFPALRIEGELGKAADGIYDRMNGIGAHEVVIETPSHDIDLFDLPEGPVPGSPLGVPRTACSDLKNDHRFKSVIIFKNHGSDAGASLTHSHSQLIALPRHPKQACVRRLSRCRGLLPVPRTGASSATFIVQENGAEMPNRPGDRRVPRLRAVRPAVPLRDLDRPEAAPVRLRDDRGGGRPGAGRRLPRTLRRLNIALENPPFQFHHPQRPFQERAVDFYHWHIEIMPELTKVAGFEWDRFLLNPTRRRRSARVPCASCGMRGGGGE
jgi:UDPglucose--hexose-1-phosphate uridylyltransferase